MQSVNWCTNFIDRGKNIFRSANFPTLSTKNDHRQKFVAISDGNMPLWRNDSGKTFIILNNALMAVSCALTPSLLYWSHCKRYSWWNQCHKVSQVKLVLYYSHVMHWKTGNMVRRRIDIYMRSLTVNLNINLIQQFWSHESKLKSFLRVSESSYFNCFWMHVRLVYIM